MSYTFNKEASIDNFVEYPSKPCTIEWLNNKAKLITDGETAWCRTSLPFSKAPIAGETLIVSFDVVSIDSPDNWRFYINDDITDTGSIVSDINLDVGHYAYEVTAAAGGGATLDLSCIFMSSEIAD
jgi:hypothetical protein